MTLAMAKALVKLYGCTLRKVHGEYQVVVPWNKAATYFTDDLEDAVYTARAISLEPR